MIQKTFREWFETDPDEPIFEDFLRLVRLKMVENGEDPDALEPDDANLDQENNTWLQ